MQGESPLRAAGILRRAAATLTVIGAVLISAGCGPSSTTADNATTPASLNLSMPGPITGVDPANTILQQNVWFVHLLFGTLFSQVPGSADRVQPALAESGALADDQRSAVVTLKPGLKFADGTPLTANDVAAGYNHVLTSKSIGALFFRGITAVSADGDSKVEFTFATPNPNYQEQLAQFPFGIVPAGSWEKKGFALKPVTSGQYMVDGNLTGNTVTLVRNPNYAGPRPSVEKLVWHVTGDPSAALNQLVAGQLDWATEIPASSVKSLSKSMKVDVNESWGVTGLTPNPHDPLTADPGVRRAIAFAIDRTQLAEIASSGTSAPLSDPLSANFPAADAAENQIYPKSGDAGEAKRLLAGTACAAGCDLQLLLNSSDPSSTLIGTAVQQQLKGIGITLQLINLDQSTWDSRAFAGNFQLLLTGGGGFGYAPTLTLNFNPKGPTKALFSEWSDPDVPAALDAAYAATEAQRPQALRRLVTLFDKSTPWVPLLSRPQLSAATPSAAQLISFSPTGLPDVEPSR